jgi:hypothetical protein
MDTDELSTEAYEAVIMEAEDFNHDLTTHFGLLAEDCKDEEEYLLEALKMATSLRKTRAYQLEDIFFEEIPDLKEFRKCLDKIVMNIKRVSEIPPDQRHYDEWEK